MINFTVITKALEMQFKNAPKMQDFIISRGGILNLNSGNTPWVGIYRNTVLYEPKSLGRGARNWKTDIEIRLIVQATNLESPEKAEEELEEALENTIDSIELDRSIDKTVGVINGYEVTNYSYAEMEEATLAFQQAEIIIKAESRS